MDRDPDDDAPPPRAALVAGGVFEAALVLAAFGLGALVGVNPLATLRLDARDALWGAAAAVPMLAGFLLTLRLDWAPFRLIRETLDEHLVPIFSHATWLDVLAVSALAGIGEEMLFRGVVQAAVAEQAGWLGGIVVASFLFGVAHLLTPTYAIVAALLGAWMGWVWIETGSLLAPVVAHALYDFAGLMILLRRKRG